MQYIHLFLLSYLAASDMTAFNEDKIDIYHLNSLLLSFSNLPTCVVNLPGSFTCQWEGAAVARSSATPTYPNCPSCLSSLAPSADGKTMATQWSSLFISILEKQEQGESNLARENSTPSPLFSSSDVDSLQLLYLGAVELNNQIDHLLSMATMIRHKKYSSKPQASLSSLVATFVTCASYPVQLFGMNDLQRIIRLGEEWYAEVLPACKPNAPTLSLNRLEALISDGEKLPIDFSKELDALREKRGAGKLWLDKFRKSMSTSGASRVSREGGAAAEGGSGGGGGKMDLASMKRLIEEGGQLYEDRNNKDLNKGMNVVDDAEDLISRFKGIISGGAASSSSNKDEGDIGKATEEEEEQEKEEEEGDESRDLELLKDLLEETESMPVAMEEVQLLRAHIETVEWAEKARPILKMNVKKASLSSTEGDQGEKSPPPEKRYRISTLLKLQKDLLKTRVNMSAEMKKQFQAIKFKLPEETKLQKVLNMIEKFQMKVKKRFTSCASGSDDLLTRNSALRSSVTLSALRQMIVDMNAILELVDLDFDTESEYLHKHVNAAEEWLKQHHDTLMKLDIKVTSFSTEANVEDSGDEDDDGEEEEDGDIEQRGREVVLPENVTETMDVDTVDVAEDSLDISTTTPPVEAASVPVLIAIDTIDADSLIDYDVLNDLIQTSTKSVLSCFPELTAAKRRLEDVDAWLEEINSHQPKQKQGDSTEAPTDGDEDEDEVEVITTTELQDMISNGMSFKVNLIDEMKRIRTWIRQAEQWEIDAQPAFAAIIQSVGDTVGQFQSALSVSQRNVVVKNVTVLPNSYVRFPFLQGLENPLDEFADIFSLTPEDLHCCLKYPSSLSAAALSIDNLLDMDVNVGLTSAVTPSSCCATPQQLEEALQPIIHLRQSINTRMVELMNKRRQQVGGIILTHSSRVHSSDEEAQGSGSPPPINLGVLLDTLAQLLKWIEQLETLLTFSSSAMHGGGVEQQWGDINEDIINQAMKDVSQIVSLDHLQETYDEVYTNTLLHSSIPLDYFYASPALIPSQSEENDDNEEVMDVENDQTMDVEGKQKGKEEGGGDDSKTDSPSMADASSQSQSPRSKSSRSHKKRSIFEQDDLSSSSTKRQATKKLRDDNLITSKDFTTFEKHSTRKSKKQPVVSAGATAGVTGGLDETVLSASSSPVAASIYFLYHSYTYPAYRPIQMTSSIRKGSRESDKEGTNTQRLPSPVLQLVDLWVRMLNLLLVRKEEAALFISVADGVVKKQIAEKSYKGVKTSALPNNASTDPLFRPIWHSISFTPTYAAMVYNLVLWGTKRNIALRTRYVCMMMMM
jgi:hypothetical protein